MPVNNSKPIRERRRADAEARQAAHAKRSAADQLALIEQRPGASRRERARLSA